MEGKNTNNKDFWDDYVTYFAYKTEEANTDKKADNKISGDKFLKELYSALDVKPKERFLDFGCGIGNLYRVICDAFADCRDTYFGLDVSRRSLEYAEKLDGLKIGKNLMEYDGGAIPFQEESFEKIMCFGVFDACDQEKTLSELLRILSKGGFLLISGKGSHYFPDDEPAYVAEVNARKKEHPNSFTNVSAMLGQLKAQGVEVVESYYYLYREDIAEMRYEKKQPERFYEWVYILKKTEAFQPASFTKFSDFYSDTYKERTI